MTKKTTLWIVQGLLALLFLFAGGTKLVLPIEELTKDMALPGLFVRFIGVAEVLGAVGLILPGLLRIRPVLTALAAAGLAIIMIGATAVTLAGDQRAAAPIPLVVGLLLAYVGWNRFAETRPDTFRVQRSTRIEAEAEAIYALIHDFHRWASWSPYEKLDPALRRTYSGALNGKGAVYEWAGTRKVGQGRMEITDTSPGSKVTIQLDFLKPFECHNTAEFTLEAEGRATKVTWAMHGPQSGMTKAMSIFFSMDSLVGKDFEKGLANMKAIAEINSNQRSAVCN